MDTICATCQADHDEDSQCPVAIAEREPDPRERGDDDGVEYADPNDELDRRLMED